MRVLILTLCLLKLAQAENWESQFKTVRYDLVIPETHEGFNDDSKIVNRPGRVINGHTAVDGQFPWAARLTIARPGGNIACSASIVSNRFVLSAEHCVRGSTSIQVAAGSADRLGPNMRTFFSEAFFVPEPLNPGGGIPDITIIRLNTNISFTNNLQPIRLPNREWGNFDYAGWEFNIMGFGGDNSGGLARILQYGYFRVHTSGACNFQQWEFCGLASRNSITSTQGGDSGGPWVVNVAEGGSSVPVLMSPHWGRVTNSTHNRHISVRISSFRQFISDSTGGLL